MGSGERILGQSSGPHRQPGQREVQQRPAANGLPTAGRGEHLANRLQLANRPIVDDRREVVEHKRAAKTIAVDSHRRHYDQAAREGSRPSRPRPLRYDFARATAHRPRITHARHVQHAFLVPIAICCVGPYWLRGSILNRRLLPSPFYLILGRAKINIRGATRFGGAKCILDNRNRGEAGIFHGGDSSADRADPKRSGATNTGGNFEMPIRGPGSRPRARASAEKEVTECLTTWVDCLQIDPLPARCSARTPTCSGRGNPMRSLRSYGSEGAPGVNRPGPLAQGRALESPE
jgi:hypothetical protein